MSASGPQRCMPWVPRGLLALLLLLSWLGSTPAQAGPQQEAERLLKQGKALLKRGKHGDALITLMKAQGTYPSDLIRLEIAAANEGLGNAVDAAQIYEELAAGQGLFGAPKERCAERLAALRAQLARITVSCSITGATVTVGDREVGKVPLDFPIYVEPGEVTVTVSSADRKLSQDHTLAAGENKALSFELRSAASAPAAAPVAPAAPVTSPDALPPPTSDAAQKVQLAPTSAARPRAVATPMPHRDSGSKGWLLGRRWTWIAAAGTLAAGAAALGIGLSARSDYETYKDDATPRSDYPELEDRLSTKATTVNVMLGVTGALAATTAVLFFVEGMGSSRRGPPRSTRAAVMPGPGGGQVVLHTSF